MLVNPLYTYSTKKIAHARAAADQYERDLRVCHGYSPDAAIIIENDVLDRLRAVAVEMAARPRSKPH